MTRAPVWEPAVGATVEWYTPPGLFDSLGIRFDLDVAAPPGGVAWVPCDKYLTAEDNGLWVPWSGRVWCNPPYDDVDPWAEKIAAHGDGMLLMFSRTETRAWQTAAKAASAVSFLRDRLWFHRSDGYRGRAAAGSTLFAFGPECAEALVRADLGWTIE
jgi:hypothetical protein